MEWRKVSTFLCYAVDTVFIRIVAQIECCYRSREWEKRSDIKIDFRWQCIPSLKKVDSSLTGNFDGKYRLYRNGQFSPWFPLIHREFMIRTLLIGPHWQYCTALLYWIVSRFDENSWIDVHTMVRSISTQLETFCGNSLWILVHWFWLFMLKLFEFVFTSTVSLNLIVFD